MATITSPWIGRSEHQYYAHFLAEMIAWERTRRLREVLKMEPLAKPVWNPVQVGVK